MIKQYVKYFVSALPDNQEITEEVQDRNPRNLRIPYGCYKLRFFDVQEVLIEGKVSRTEPFNESTAYYTKGCKPVTVEFVERWGNSSKLIKIIKEREPKQIIYLPGGGFEMTNEEVIFLN